MTQDRPTQWWGKFTQVEWGAYFIHNGGGVGAHYIGGELTKLGYIGGGGGSGSAPPPTMGNPVFLANETYANATLLSL